MSANSLKQFINLFRIEYNIGFAKGKKALRSMICCTIPSLYDRIPKSTYLLPDKIFIQVNLDLKAKKLAPETSRSFQQ